MDLEKINKNIPNFCIAPWLRLTVTPEGNLRPCCDFDGVVGNIKKRSLKAEYNSPRFQNLRKTILSGRIHPGCASCFEKKRNIGESVRQSTLKWANRWSIEKSIDGLKVKTTTSDIKWLDIRLSNTCNLKCRHCYPHLSSQWLHELKAMQPVNCNNNKIIASWLNHSYKFNKKETNLPTNIINDIIEEIGQNLKRIEFKGGEPFFNNEIYHFLDNLYKKVSVSNNQPDLIFVTNGSVFLKNINVLEKFTNVKINFSIEGVGKAYSYIRGGRNVDLDNLKKNVILADALPNTTTSFRITIMAYNIFEIPKMLEWIFALSLKKMNQKIGIENYVVEPKFLRVAVIPLEIRLAAQRNLEKFITKLPPETISESNITFMKSLGEHDEAWSKKYLSSFIEYTRLFDKVRGESVVKSIPELKSIFK